ncbi:UvrD-helicase domain-containing protein [Streptomyces sp. 6N223]|uniref:UvrD-helicase domain-containing protein n=1 Tax=Streptomyces sp. 6N223 TaxID=3457412 RepID=UPI003FD590A8
MEPTEEQAAAADAFTAGDHLVLQAGAGTGKTTTLAMLAASTPRRGRYIAFNRSIAQAAAAVFPQTVTCKTAHSLAFAAVGRRYAGRLNAPRVPSWKQGMHLDLTSPLTIDGRTIPQPILASVTLRTVTTFCHSADPTLQIHHVPHLRGLDTPERHSRLAEAILPHAEKAWADVQHPDRGAVRFNHDHYLKIWALSDPVIDADYLLLDEAQDTNPVLEEVFTRQRDRAQLVMVGDSAQAIYGWRGAKDVMTDFKGTALTLSRSFRFGPALAEEANRWLTLVDAPIRLTGTDTIPSRIGPLERPDAILCRTNVGTMIEIMNLLPTGRRVALAGGAEPLRALARAADDLQHGRRTTHPELLLFERWGDLKDYAEYDPAGGDLAPLVEVVEQHGTRAILAAVDQLAPEEYAQVTVSTAHKAKGREWPTVRISADFTPDDAEEASDETNEDGQPPPSIDPDEARLAYVAVTRARYHLDPGELASI